jgi:ABC-type transporter Mla MlaB component
MATETVTLNCARMKKPDLASIGEIAQVQLGMRRCGCEVRLTQASEELIALIQFAGLGDVLRVEVQRKSEQRKEPRRVEEECELADPPV